MNYSHRLEDFHLNSLRQLGIGLLDRTRRAFIAKAGGVTIGVRGLVCDSSRGVLLVRHTWRPGWHTPGGGVQRGESPHEAVARELFEEVGIELAAPPKLVHVYVQLYRGVSDYPIFFLVDKFRGNPEINDKGEIAEIRWFSMSEAIRVTGPRTSEFLKEFNDGGPYRERWEL